MMKKFGKNNYSAIDRPEILSYIFYPRRENTNYRSESCAEDMLIPVEGNDICIGVRFHFVSNKMPTILFFHGNGEIAADYDHIGSLYTSMGINFAVADYRGYGISAGRPTVAAMMTDCHIILEHLLKKLSDEHCSTSVIVMGRSLGSASALELAYRHPELAGLIIESGFAYMMPLLQRIGIPRTVDISEEDGCMNIEKIKEFKKPTLIIHALYDDIIPFSEGKALYEASGAYEKRFLTIPDADHNTIFIRGFREYLSAVADFTNALTA
ncbi:MAG: alpha/beta hydrolase [Syntrophales bacterium]|nr:alpha/beta hydrolase [Syntrophales bacterium]MDY0045446.1 alpha/beta hydrolase [Syntrophales bacterium]